MKYIHMFLTATLFLTASSSIVQSTPMQDATQNEQQTSYYNEQNILNEYQSELNEYQAQISCYDRTALIAEIVKVVAEAQEIIKQGGVIVYDEKNKLFLCLWVLIGKNITTPENENQEKKNEMLLNRKKFSTYGLLCLVGNIALYFLPIMQNYKQISYAALNTSLPICSLYFLIQACIPMVNTAITQANMQSELAQSLSNIIEYDISDMPTIFLDRAMHIIEPYVSDDLLLNEHVLSEIKENIQNDKAEIEARIKNL